MDTSTPALLFPAIAILTLGYINRYLGIANVARGFRKDYDIGAKRVELKKQLKILKKRLEITRLMLMSAAVAMIMACTSMLFLFIELRGVGEVLFGISIYFMVFSLLMSLYETSLSNKSLFIEIDDILSKK
ncbi:DUF2721 domain-containing protein [Candidatus Saccharibacteria bacterium]|nr:DUF2721 domain-containing protein [Candidatus Saccharibacteria bacterium]